MWKDVETGMEWTANCFGMEFGNETAAGEELVLTLDRGVAGWNLWTLGGLESPEAMLLGLNTDGGLSGDSCWLMVGV